MASDTITQALEIALDLPTLKEALSYMCTWETERVVKQVLYNYGSGSDDTAWDTCFGIIISTTLDKYIEKHPTALSPRGYY